MGAFEEACGDQLTGPALIGRDNEFQAWLCKLIVAQCSLMQYFQKNPKLAETSRRLKSQIWSSVVTIVLVEARSIPPDIDGSTSEPYVKFRYDHFSCLITSLYLFLLL